MTGGALLLLPLSLGLPLSYLLKDLSQLRQSNLLLMWLLQDLMLKRTQTVVMTQLILPAQGTHECSIRKSSWLACCG